MSIFTGAAVAIVTPFNGDGSVNYEKLDNLIEFQIKNSTDAIVICGTTGEASTLSHEEHLDVVRHCIETVNHRVPVIAGTGSNSTETAIYLSKEAEKAGADAVLLVTPYYNKATQGGLYVHFKDTADAINIPCILYNVPSRTGCNILPETAVKLAKDVKNIVAIWKHQPDCKASSACRWMHRCIFRKRRSNRSYYVAWRNWCYFSSFKCGTTADT